MVKTILKDLQLEPENSFKCTPHLEPSMSVKCVTFDKEQ